MSAKMLSCMLRGADGLLAHLCQTLRIAPGETTADGEFTVIPSECLAACDRAPMMIIDDQVVGPVQEKDLDRILGEAKKSRPPFPDAAKRGIPCLKCAF